MTERNYRISLTVKNYKSYYDSVTRLSLTKPVTVLAGPNGEGKSNLLEALLIPTSDFMAAAYKFRDTSLFNRQVPISDNPTVTLSYHDLIFCDHVLRSMHRSKSEVGPPQRFHPGAVVSEGKRVSRLTFSASRDKGSRQRTLGEFETEYRSQEKSTSGIKTNSFDDFDILYSTPDSVLADFMVHLFADEIIHKWSDYPGAGQKARYVQAVLGYFPEGNERLIRDVSEDGFLERFLGDTHRFLRENLATGAKKEVLIYLIGLVLERFRADNDNLLLVVLDEVESGINVLRQRLMVEALLHVLNEFPEKQEQVKVVLSTHSPVVFSELGEREELVDVFYVLRDDNAPSRLYNARDNEWPQQVEKRILLELGLNVFDLPHRVVFVEGETDQLFLENVFSNCHVTPLHGGNVPRILRQLLGSIRLAWEKQYTVLVDADKVESIEADIDRFREGRDDDVKIDVSTHGHDSLEEFFLDVDLSRPLNAQTLWVRIEKRMREVNETLSTLGEEPLQYDIPQIRSKLESQGKGGVENFVDSIKTNRRLYRIFGRYWRELLSEKGREFVSDFQTSHQLRYKKW